MEGKGNLSRRNRPRPWHVLRAVPFPARQPICLPCRARRLPAQPPHLPTWPQHMVPQGDGEQGWGASRALPSAPSLLPIVPQDVGLSPLALQHKPWAVVGSGVVEQPAAWLGTRSPSWAACYSTM